MGAIGCCYCRDDGSTQDINGDYGPGFANGKVGEIFCGCADFHRSGTCKHIGLGTPRSLEACSCTQFRQTGHCKHLSPWLPRTPRLIVDQSSTPRIIVNGERIAWYKRMDKCVEARSANSCGIFLDVDGVMHPYGAYGPESFCHMALLLKIIEATKCDIVLSSSWRLDVEGIQEVNNHLRKARQDAGCDDEDELWKAELLDITGNLMSGRCLNNFHNRDLEILSWVKCHAAEAGWDNRWIAIDDLDMSEALGDDHTVITQCDDGLTEEKVEEAIAKMKALRENPSDPLPNLTSAPAESPRMSESQT